MFWSRTPSRSRLKPRYPRVQWRHPLATGLQHLYAFEAMAPAATIASTRVRDLAGAAHLDPGSGNTMDWAFGLPGGSLNPGNTLLNQAVSYVPPPFSIALVFNAVLANAGALFSHDAAGGNDGYRVQAGASNVHLTFGGVADYTGVAYSTGIWYVGLFTCAANGGTAKTYLRPLIGGAIATNSETVGTVSGTPTAIGVSGRGAAGTQNSDAAFALVAQWARVLTDADALSVLTHPWAVITPPKARLSAMNAGGGGGGAGSLFWWNRYGDAAA